MLRGALNGLEKAFMTIDELFEYLSLKRSTLYTMVENRQLPHYRIGRLIRFKKLDIDRWMEGHRKEAIDLDEKASRTLNVVKKPAREPDKIVQKSIAEVKRNGLSFGRGKPDRIKGLGKEAENGSL